MVLLIYAHCAFFHGLSILFRFVQARNTKVVGAAARSSAIVSSLFPEAVRERLMAQQMDDAKSRNLKGFLASDKSDLTTENKSMLFLTKPIADLFPETTIIFADIVNFTAWSSVRDPSQVFVLLETVYNAFDDIARKRRVFKVETIGDCYVAVCGLPEPAKDHAVRMARFAKDCMRKMWSIVKSLESTLGPDTGDLVRLRFSRLCRA
jgi:class 3 adenylate cyclase